MKSTSLFFIILLGFTFNNFAQNISNNAIGLRLGDSNGLGAEISYQRAILDNNRLEFDFGWRNGNDYDGVKGTGLFQWVMPLDGSFNWYFGAGGGLAAYRFDFTGNTTVSDTFVFAAGDVGIEYKFDIPLLLSLDVRPELGFGEDRFDNNDLDFDVAFSVRYTF